MLFKKMIRDLWKNKVQFGAIFIMMFLGVFIRSEERRVGKEC